MVGLLLAAGSSSPVLAQRSWLVPDPCVQPRGQAYFAFQLSAPAVFAAAPGISPRPTARAETSSVVIEFVVDTLGRVELPTVKAHRVRDSTLFADVLRRLPEWRFMPAVWNDCWVARQLIVAGIIR